MVRLLGPGLLLGVLLLGATGEAAPRPGFGWPLSGTPVVARAFAPPATDYGPGHRGVDLRAPAGAPVLAAAAGWVSYAGVLAGRGVVVVTHPGGLRTTYEPVEATVAVGEPVALGEVLGEVSTGHGSCRADSTCLHWGLRRGQDYLDPLSLVQPGPVRLLPVGPGPAPGHRPAPLVRPRAPTAQHRAGLGAEAGREAGGEAGGEALPLGPTLLAATLLAATLLGSAVLGSALLRPAVLGGRSAGRRRRRLGEARTGGVAR